MIVGIQTSGIGKVNVGNAKAVGMRNRAEEKVSEEFAGLMNLSGQTMQTENRDVQAKTDKTMGVSDRKPVFAMNASYSDASERIQERTTDNRTDTTKNAKASENEQTDKADTKVQADSKTDAAGKEAPADSAKVDNAKDELADRIKQVLGIDDEELQQLLEDAGLSMQELLNPEVLQQFVLQVMDASSVDLLIDENLNQVVNQLLQVLDEVLTEYDITESMITETFPEEDMQQLELETSVEGENPVLTDANADVKSDTMVKPVDENQAETQMPQEIRNKDAEVEVDAESQIKVTVQTQAVEQISDQSGQMNQNQDTILANFNQALNQLAGNEMTEVNGFSEQITQADILRQVVDEIKLSMSRDVNSLSVQLNPEQLGKVQIHVATRNGVMQAQIIAENEAAKNAVESGLSVLRETLENQDLKVDAIEVMVGTRDYFSESGQDAQSGNAERENNGNRTGGINLNDTSDDEISEEKQLEAEMMKAQGSSVNYTA